MAEADIKKELATPKRPDVSAAPRGIVPFRYCDPARTPAVAVVIPVLNEEQAIGAVLDEVPGDLVRYVVVVDNGSTDQTCQVARRHGASVESETKRGYGAACWKGIAVLPKDVEIIVFLDGDHSDYPADMRAILEPILSDEADLVIGSRTLGGAEKGSLFPQQRFGNWLATGLIRLLTGMQYSDLGPFRAVRKKDLDRVQMADRGFGWTVEMQMKAPRLGLRITEVSVRYRRRIGTSKISGTIMGSLKAGWTILNTIWQYRKSEPQTLRT